MVRARIFVLLAALISADAFACTVPRSGHEYDKLVSVKRVVDNKFEITVPVVAEDLHFGTAIKVAYYKSGREHRFGEYYKDVQARDDGHIYRATVELVKIEGYTPYVEAFWFPKQCCTCGAYGKSNDLVLK